MKVELLNRVNQGFIPLVVKDSVWFLDFKNMKITWEKDNVYEYSNIKRVNEGEWFFGDHVQKLDLFKVPLESNWTTFGYDDDYTPEDGPDLNLEVEKLYQEWSRNENSKR